MNLNLDHIDLLAIKYALEISQRYCGDVSEAHMKAQEKILALLIRDNPHGFIMRCTLCKCPIGDKSCDFNCLCHDIEIENGGPLGGGEQP